MTVDKQRDKNCANTIIDSHVGCGFNTLSESRHGITKGTKKDLARSHSAPDTIPQ